MVATSANSLNLSSTTAGQIVQAQSSGIPTFSTSTYPSTNAANTLLYASSANTMAALATANNGVLITSSGGVPSISSTLPTAVQGNITSVGNLGNQTNTTRSSFYAYRSTTASNVTGDGTVYQVVFNSTAFNVGTGYSTSTGAFTAPVTGTYLFCWGISLTGLAVGNTSSLMYIQSTQDVNTFFQENLSAASVGGALTVSGSVIITMTANDIVAIQVQVSGATKIVGAAGATRDTGTACYFSGALLF